MTAQTTFGLTMLAGVYAAVSPWLIGFHGDARHTVNALIVGLCVAVLAGCFASALDRTHGLTWTLPVLGVWLIISPWLFGGGPSAGMIWSHVIVGALVTLFGFNAAYFGMRVRSGEGRHG